MSSHFRGTPFDRDRTVSMLPKGIDDVLSANEGLRNTSQEATNTQLALVLEHGQIKLPFHGGTTVEQWLETFQRSTLREQKDLADRWLRGVTTGME
jgi:hypothetical protein